MDGPLLFFVSASVWRRGRRAIGVPEKVNHFPLAVGESCLQLTCIARMARGSLSPDILWVLD